MKRDSVTRSIHGLNFDDIHEGTLLDVIRRTTLNGGTFTRKKIKTVTVLEKYPFIVVCEDDYGRKETYCSGDYYCGDIVKTPEMLL